MAHSERHNRPSKYRVPFEALQADTVICRCCNITFSMLRSAVENGAVSADEVAEQTSNQLMCRKCVDYMESIIRKLKA